MLSKKQFLFLFNGWMATELLKEVKMMGNRVSLLETLCGMRTGAVARARRNALTTKLKSHTIDTCYTIDTCQWETGILPKNREWIIVEQYADKKEAEAGHKKWVKRIKKNPKLELRDVLEYGL